MIDGIGKKTNLIMKRLVPILFVLDFKTIVFLFNQRGNVKKDVE